MGISEGDVTEEQSLSDSEVYQDRMFSLSVDVNAATSGVDNPLVLLRNPVGSNKNIVIFKVSAGTPVANVSVAAKIFVNVGLTTSPKTITNITQSAFSTTVTVTTSVAHNGTVGATVVISGTTNFNGTYSIASITSSTVFTFTRTAVLVTTTETSGTATITVSLGTAAGAFPLRRDSSLATAVGLTSTLPTLSSNGDCVIGVVQGQNSSNQELIDTPMIFLESGQAAVITASPGSNNRLVTVTITWSERPV